MYSRLIVCNNSSAVAPGMAARIVLPKTHSLISFDVLSYRISCLCQVFWVHVAYITWLNICMSKSNLIGISSLYSVLSKSLNGQPIYTIVYRNTGSGQHISSSYGITFPTGLL